MRRALTVKVKESLSELKQSQKKHPHKFKPLQMLLLLKKNEQLTKMALAVQTGSSDKSIQTWRTQYLQGGLEAVLQERRGGKKKAAITEAAHQKLAARLNNPSEGFRTFTDIQQWLLDEFGIGMQYQAVNKYVKRRFGARPKVGRKSHVKKSAADEAVFKNASRKIRTH